jgi:ABC-2 type transport system ATP-binding protein
MFAHGKGLSVLVSSHLLPDIERTCDSVIVMKGGKVVTARPVKALRETVGVQMEVSLREFSARLSYHGERGGEISHQQGSELRFLSPTRVPATRKPPLALPA